MLGSRHWTLSLVGRVSRVNTWTRDTHTTRHQLLDLSVTYPVTWLQNPIPADRSVVGKARITMLRDLKR